MKKDKDDERLAALIFRFDPFQIRPIYDARHVRPARVITYHLVK